LSQSVEIAEKDWRFVDSLDPKGRTDGNSTCEGVIETGWHEGQVSNPTEVSEWFHKVLVAVHQFAHHRFTLRQGPGNSECHRFLSSGGEADFNISEHFITMVMGWEPKDPFWDIRGVA
jgi:hypothetical protein